MPEQIGLQAVFDVSGFNAGVQVYLQQINNITSETQKAASSLTKSNNALVTGLGAAAGTAVINGLSGIANAIRSIGQEALESVRFFERLEFSLQTLSAISLVQEGAFDNIADALGTAKLEAQGYLLVLQDLAIFSPFTTQQVADFNRLLNVYGFARDEALRLTESLVDFGSAAGFSPSILNRISLALGQIRTEGRLLARDALQLSQAGVPVLQVISDFTGKTVQELQEVQRQGQLSSKVVFESLIQFFDQFEGSGRRVSKTLNGLLSSLEDIREITFRDFFTGVFEPLLPVLQELVDLFSSPDFRAGIIIIGEAIGGFLVTAVEAARNSIASLITTVQNLPQEILLASAAFIATTAALTAFVAVAGVAFLAINALLNPFVLAVTAVGAFAAAYVVNFNRVDSTTSRAVASISNSIGNLIDGFVTLSDEVTKASGNIGEQFNIVASSAVEWGQNIVQSLADGVVGAVNIVIEAISTIGEVFAFFMAPGSPPRFLPDLRVWGKAAADEYLDSWTDADFGALSSVGSAIKSQLQSLVSLGDLDESGASSIILSARDEIARAIAQIQEIGQVTAETFERIRSAAGPVSDEIIGFISRYTELSNATKRVTDAQNALNRVQTAFSNLVSAATGQADAATEAKRQADEQLEILSLQRLIAREGVSDERRQVAQARIVEIGASRRVRLLEQQRDAAEDTAQSELDAALAQEKVAQDNLSLFEQRLQIQGESLNLLGEEVSRVEALNDAVNSGLNNAYKRTTRAVNKQLEGIKLQQEELRDVIAAAKARNVLEDANSTAAQKSAAQLKLQEISIRQQIRDVKAAELGIDLQELRNTPVVLADIGKKGKAAFSELSDGADFAGGSLADVKGKLEEFNQSLTNARTKFTQLSEKIGLSINQLNDSLPSFLKIRREADGTIPAIATLTGAFTSLATLFAARKIAPAIGAIIPLFAKLGPVGIAASAGVTAFAVAYETNFLGIQDITDNVIGNVIKTIQGLGQVIDPTGLPTGFSLLTFFENAFSEAGLNSLLESLGFQTTINEFLTSAIEGAVVAIPGIFVSALTAVGTGLAASLQGLSFFAEFGTGLVNGLTSVLTVVVTALSNGLREILKLLLSGSFSELIAFISSPAIFAGLGEALQPFLNALGAVWGEWVPIALANLGAAFADLLSALSGLIVFAVGSAALLGASIAAGIVEGLSAWFLGPEAAQRLSDTFDRWIDGIKLYFGIASPSSLLKDEVGAPAGEGLIQGIIDFIKSSSAILTEAFDFILSILFNEENKAKIQEGASAIGQIIIDTFAFAIEGGELSLTEAFTALRKAIFSEENKTAFKDEIFLLGQEMMVDFAKGIASNVAKPLVAMSNVAIDLFTEEKKKEFTDQSEDLGISIMDGIAGTFNAQKQGLSNALNSALDFMFGGAASEIEAQSPSKRAERELGIPIAQGLSGGLLTFDPAGLFDILSGLAVTALTTFKDSTVAVIVSFVDEATFEFSRLSLNVSTELLNVATTITDTFNDFNSERLPALRTFVTASSLLFQSLALDAITSMQDIAGAVSDSFTAVSDSVTTILGPATMNAVNLFSAMVTEILTKIASLASGVTGKLNEVLKEIEKLESNFEDAGRTLGNKLIDGILDKIVERKGEIRDAVAAAVIAGRQQSAVTQDTVQSASVLGEGITSSVASGIASSMDIISSSLSASISNALNSVDLMLAPSPSQISPGGVTFNNTYSLNVTSSSPSQGVVKDFDTMRILS